MKKRLLYLLLFCYTSAVLAGPCKDIFCGECECKATSHTFFSVRPLFQGESPERLTGFRDRMAARVDGYHGAVQVALYGGKSTRSDRLARYFMPFCKSHLKVIENEADRTDPTDLLANQFNIYTVREDFQSFIEFKPQHSSFGFAIDYKQEIFERSDGRAIWFNVTLPIEHVTNNINLCEAVVNDGGGIEPNATSSANAEFPFAVPNMVEAFKQPAWLYGRIEDGNNNKCPKSHCCRTSKTSLASVDFRLGYEIIEKEECYMSSFIGVIIPAGNSPKAVTVFEPIVGHNKHWGVEFGTNLGFQLWHHKDAPKKLNYELGMNGVYFFAKSEVRSFDIKCKPWSRYMQVYRNREQAQCADDLYNRGETELAIQLHTPGINIFTRCLRIKPRLSRTINNALTYTSYNLKLELGYNFFCRQCECAELVCPWVEGPAFKDIADGRGQTDNVQIINNDFNNNNNTSLADYETNLIRREDLDLGSATHPGMVTHTFYGFGSYRWDDQEFPTFAGLGGSYEVSTDNVGLDRWTIWGKFGLSF